MSYPYCSVGILIGSAGAIGSLINEMILPNFQVCVFSIISTCSHAVPASL